MNTEPTPEDLALIRSIETPDDFDRPPNYRGLPTADRLEALSLWADNVADRLRTVISPELAAEQVAFLDLVEQHLALVGRASAVLAFLSDDTFPDRW